MKSSVCFPKAQWYTLQIDPTDRHLPLSLLASLQHLRAPFPSKQRVPRVCTYTFVAYFTSCTVIRFIKLSDRRIQELEILSQHISVLADWSLSTRTSSTISKSWSRSSIRSCMPFPSDNVILIKSTSESDEGDTVAKYIILLTVLLNFELIVFWLWYSLLRYILCCPLPAYVWSEPQTPGSMHQRMSSSGCSSNRDEIERSCEGRGRFSPSVCSILPISQTITQLRSRECGSFSSELIDICCVNASHVACSITASQLVRSF